MLVSASVCPWSALAAQASEPAPAAEASSHCLMGNRLVRGLGGATLGAWLGFVTAKIRVSDWNDGSRTSAGVRQRNQATAIGAAAGALIGVLVPHGCSASAVPGQSTRPGRLPIMADEIRRSGVSGSVYDVVYSLRRNWLNVRGVEDMNEAPRNVTDANGQEVIQPGEPKLIVYLDNMRMGTIGELHNLPTTGVVAIRYFDPTQANMRWGTGHTHGAIQVLTVLDQ
jgi:hypothetical protein